MVKSSPQKGTQPSVKQLSECGWLKRLPSNNPNDASGDEDQVMNMKAFWKVCHLLWTNPRLSLQAASWVEDRVGTQVAGVVNTELMFAVAPDTIAQVEIDFKISYIISCNKGWTEGGLGKARAFDSEQITFIFCDLINVKPTLQLSPDCQNKLLLRKACDERRAGVGPRQEKPTTSDESYMIEPSGKVKWENVGPYDFELAEHRLVTVTHKPSKSSVSVDQNIDIRDYKLDNGWSDWLSGLYKSKTDKIKFVDFFGRFAGPNSMPALSGFSKDWREIELKAKSACDAQFQQATAGALASPSDKASEAVKRKREEACAKARLQLAARVEERAAKRRTSLAI